MKNQSKIKISKIYFVKLFSVIQTDSKKKIENFNKSSFEDAKKNENINNSKISKGYPIKKPIINFSNLNKINLSSKKINPDNINVKNKDLIDIDRLANADKSKNFAFNDIKDANEKKSKSSDKKPLNAPDIPSKKFLRIFL